MTSSCSLKSELSTTEVDEMEELFENFVDTTEDIYYQGIDENLAICTSQLHGLLHVGTTIRALGPTYVSWQFGMERFAGKIVPLTTSKSQMNVSLYNELEALEQVRWVKSVCNIESSRPVSTPYVSKELQNDENQKIGMLHGRRLEKRTSRNETLHRLLRQYHNCDAITPDYHEWTKLSREIQVGTADHFVIATEESTRPGRDRRCCAFLCEDRLGVQILSFGRVTSFIEHQHSGDVHDLALIQEFNIIDEENAGALHYVNELALVLVKVSDIVESVGRIERVHEVRYRSRGQWRTKDESRFWIARGTRISLAMQ